ncbi:MAG: InlB B-repeat-containing protein, partial [Endomicrobiaceae bacterium]
GSLLYYDIGATLVNQQPLEPFSGTISVDYNSRHNNLMSAYENLMKRGINGPTEILLPTDEHIGQYELRYIPLLSEDASLTIKSSSYSQIPDLKYTSTDEEDNFVFNLIGVQNLTLSDIRIENEGEDFAKVINLHGYTKNLTIDDCTLAGKEVESSINSNNFLLIDARSNYSDNLTIKDSYLHHGSYAIYNDYNSTSNNALISDNTFNQNYYGIDLRYFNSLDITRNSFHLMKNTPVSLSYIDGTVNFMNNKVDYLAGKGLHFYHSNNEGYKAIVNNSFRTYGTSNNLSANIHLENVNNIDVIYNTMRHNTGAGNASFYANSQVSNIKYINNIAYKAFNNYATRFDNPSGVTEISNNLYYQTQGAAAVYFGGQTFTETADFENSTLHQNSIIANPLFNDITNSLLPSSPAIGAGLASDWIFTDIDGNPRGETPAIGAHEYVEPVFSPPTNLRAMARVNQVNLIWDEPEDMLAAGFNVYRDSIKINTELISEHYYTDFIESENELEYYITAVYIFPVAGESNPSNTITATPLAPNFPEPTNLIASAHYDKISLIWEIPNFIPEGNLRQKTAIKQNRLISLSHYNVYRNNEFLATTPTDYYDDNTAIQDSSYTYYVTAVYQDPDGESNPSNQATASLLIPNFLTPYDLTATAEINQITLNWQHQDHNSIRNNYKLRTVNYLRNNRDNMIIAGYNVYRDSTLINESIITELNYTDTDVLFGNSYEYCVTAVYSYPEGESNPSEPVTSSPLPAEYIVTININPETSGIVTGAGSYDEGDEVTISATPNPGYQFINWIDLSQRNTQNILQSSRESISSKKANRETTILDSIYTFIMPNHNKLFSANFELVSYNLTLVVNPENTGTVSGPETFNLNTIINETDLLVENNAGWTFIGWTSDAEGNNPVVFPVTMPTEDVTWYAQFEQVEYTVNLSVNPENAGEVTGAGSYHYNDSVTVTATANDGYQFVNWTSETEGRNILSSSNQLLTSKNMQRHRDIVSTDSVYTFAMPANNLSLIANFELITYNLTLVINPENAGTVSGP